MPIWRRICGLVFVACVLRHAQAVDQIASTIPPVIQGTVQTYTTVILHKLYVPEPHLLEENKCPSRERNRSLRYFNTSGGGSGCGAGAGAVAVT
jgi:hypothetical protein